MRPIPEKLKQEMASDPYYKKCCLYNLGKCSGKIEWHHNLIYGGKQVNEKWCILPICHYHHEREKLLEYKDYINYKMLRRATPEDLDRFSKATNYHRMLHNLTAIYG